MRSTRTKEILTSGVAAKASLHEQPVDFTFAHSLKSGVGVSESRVVSTLVSGVERHCCKKSMARYRMHVRGIG